MTQDNFSLQKITEVEYYGSNDVNHHYHHHNDNNNSNHHHHHHYVDINDAGGDGGSNDGGSNMYSHVDQRRKLRGPRLSDNSLRVFTCPV